MLREALHLCATGDQLRHSLWLKTMQLKGELHMDKKGEILYNQKLYMQSSSTLAVQRLIEKMHDCNTELYHNSDFDSMSVMLKQGTNIKTSAEFMPLTFSYQSL